jgi:hypothetical protein
MKPSIQLVPIQLEKQLQRAVEDLLAILVRKKQVIDFYHRPDREAGRNERPGFPDICIALPSGPCAIELKRDMPSAKPSEAQARWLACWGDRGALCRNLGQVRAALRSWGVVI